MAQDNLKNLAATSETWGENDKPATASSAADWGAGDKEYRPDATARGFKGWSAEKEPGFGARFAQGVGRAVDSAHVALSGDAGVIAKVAADQERNALPQTELQRQMAQELEPYNEAAKNAQGVGENIRAWGALGLKRAGQLISNPAEAGKMIAEQIPNSIPGMVGGVAGAKAGATLGSFVAPGVGTAVGAVVGGLAGGFAGGYGLEKGGALLEQTQQKAREHGIDLQDQEAARGFVAKNLPEMDEAATRKAVGTAGTDAALNVLTMGAAGLTGRGITKEARALAKAVNEGTVSAADASTALARLEAANAARNTVGSKAARGGAVVGAEMVGEGLSEAVGQKYAYGEVDPAQVIDESLLGLGQGGAMAIGGKAFRKAAGLPDNDDAATKSLDAVHAALAKAPADAPPSTSEAPPQLGYQPDTLVVFPDGTTGRKGEVEQYIASLPENQQNAARAKLYGYEPQPATPAPEAVRPSEAMGLRTGPDAGPLENLAARSVDSGLSAQMQGAAAQAQQPEVPKRADVVAIDYSDLNDADRAAYDDYFANVDEKTDDNIARSFNDDDSDIPDFGDASNVSEEDFLRRLGASEQEIFDALQTTNGTRVPQESAAGNAAPQANEPAGASEVAGGNQAAQGQEVATPTNLREGLAKIRAQKQQEAANAQAATQEAAPAAPAVSAARPGAVEADGVERAKLLDSLKQAGATREMVLDTRLKDAQFRLSQATASPNINPADQEAEIRSLNQQIADLTNVRSQARELDERDRRESNTRFMLQGARQELDAAVRAGAITPEEAQSIAADAQKTGNAVDASEAVFNAVDSAVTASPAPNIKSITEGSINAPQTAQAQQAVAQPAQVGAAPTVPSGAPVAQGRDGAQGGQQPAAVAGLTDAATTPTNPGAQAAPAAGAQTATAAEPEFTTIKTIYGESVTVRTADLNSDKQRLRQYTKAGKSKAVPAIHRENLDLTGDKRAAIAKENADNPFFNVITTKDGGTFANQAAASRELNRLAMGETHEVVAASEVRDGAQGFVIRRKQAEAMAPRAETGANQEEAQANQAQAATEDVASNSAGQDGGVNPRVPRENRAQAKPIEQGEQKEPWQMTAMEFGRQERGNPHWNQSYAGKDDGAYLADVQATHARLVQEAIDAGKLITDPAAQQTPQDGSKSYSDGQQLGADDLLAYFDRVIAGSQKGEKIVNPRFQIGAVDAWTAQEIANYIDGYDGQQRNLRVSGRTLKHIHESRPAIAREIVGQLPGMFSNPDEVLPDPKHKNKRALLVKERQTEEGQSKPKSYVATVEVEIEIEVKDGFIDIVTIMTAPERSLKEARALKKNWPEGQQRTEQAVNSPHPLTAEAANPAADSPDARPAGVSVPPTAAAAQPITRADLKAAQQQAASIIGERIDAMTAGEVNAIAKKFLPTMGMKPTMSKANNKAAMTDPKINLEAAAAEVGATLPAEVTRALQADMEGRVADVGFAEDNPFAEYNVLAQQYGYEVRPDGAIGSDGKFPGPTMKVKGGRLRIESGSGDLLASYAGTSPDSLGKFLESFWYAEKKADGFVEQGAEEPANDRNAFTLQRLNRETGQMEPVTFERGEYVRYTVGGKDQFGDIDGISHARREFSVDGLWHPFGFAYKAERPAAPKADTAPLSSVIDKVNAKNGQGLTDADRVPEQTPSSKTPVVDRHNATMAAVREGKATPEQFKSSFEQVVSNKDAIVAELDTMTKAQLLREGGPLVQMRYANEKKAVVVDAVYRKMVGEYALGESVTYSMGKGAYEAAVRKMVEATDADKLARYVSERMAAMEEAKARRAAKAAALENPQSLTDYRSLIQSHINEGKTRKEAFLMLTPEQRIQYDTLEAESTREARENRKRAQKTEVRAAGQTTAGEIVATKHTRDGYDLFVVKLADRLSADDYKTVLASAKKLGGWYSAFRGNGAIPGFQFKDKANAEAFLALAGGDTTAAQEQVAQRRDAFEDDRSQTAVERLRAMADKLEEGAAEVEGQQRKTNTERRARFASAAMASAAADKAKAKTMRNMAQAIEDGEAKFLDAVRTKSQVDMLTSIVDTAKGAELRSKYPSYADQQKRKGEPPTAETADFAEFPSYSAFRSDLATLGRQMLEVDGTKKLGQRLMSVADDVTDAYLEFAKANIQQVSQFGRGDALAEFASKDDAERAIKRSGLTGKAIVLPIKRGQNRVILSPSEAIGRGLWQGDGDKRITLTAEFGAELVEAIGRRGNKQNQLAVPWQFQNAYDRRKALSRIGIETPSEFRAALREFIGLKEQAVANRTRELELQMVGRKADGLDFFPTSAEVADQMIEAADLTPDMAVLEPSAGMGHLADRIREAGAEPDVIEISTDRRALLEEKGYATQAVDDFLDLKPREFYTFGDTFRAPDGTEGIMRGANGNRVRLVNQAGDMVGAGYYDRADMTGVAHNGTASGYDRIIMNPPFSNRRDAEHVRHAYSLLKPGGRIVAIMGEGVFFGQDKKAQDFREWLESVGGTSEKLPEGSFMDPSLPVNTSVNARMVVIDKPEGDMQLAPRAEEADTADFAANPARRPGTAQDKAVMQAIADGKNARDVLRLIASGSKDPFLRQVAKMLLKAGVTPAIEFGHIGKDKKGNPIHGQYRGKSDTIAIAGSAEYAAERIFMHEAMHAATMRALAKPGLTRLQMQKLLEHVRKQPGVAGYYGIKSIDEFVAEVFTNPDFQAALRKMSAPSGNSAIKTAWDGFVRILRSILGLKNDHNNALSQALNLGVEAVRQDMVLRKQGMRGDGAANAGADTIDQTQTENFKRWYSADHGTVTNATPGNGAAGKDVSSAAASTSAGVVKRGTDDGSLVQRRAGVGQAAGISVDGGRITFDGASGPKDPSGRPVVFYHGTKADITAFDTNHQGKKDNGWMGRGVYLASNPELAALYSLQKRDGREPLVMPLYAAVKNPYVFSDKERRLYKNATQLGVQRLTERLKAQGYDGVVFEHDADGGVELLAFEPTQVKSAIGNNGNFDPEDPSILNFGADDLRDRATAAANTAGAAIKSVTVTNIKQKAGFKLTDYLGIGLQALGRRQIVDIYGDLLPLSEYNRLVQQMEADKNEGGAEADQLVTRWAKLSDEAKLADLMHDATLAQIDPDKPYVDGDDKAKFMMLQGRFKALSDEAKAVYRDTRDAYKDHHAKVRSAIKDRIERSEIKGARKAELLQQMDSEFFKAVKGVYFPLARFGQYAVTVKRPDGKVESVSRAETKEEAEALRSNLLAAFPRDKGFAVGRVMLSKDFIADRDAVGRGFMTELYEVLDKQDMDATQRAELEDTLGQLYLSSLPDLSWAKHGIHRKGTPGFSQDARRAFAQNMFHGARYLAKLRYSDLMQDELTAMQKHVDDWREVEDFDQNSAQRVVDEMNKRHESLMNPKSNPLSTALTSLGFVFHLGLSPASAMVNLSQTALVAYPIMGAKWGFGKASAALLKASKQAAEGKNDITGSLNADELAAYNEAVRAGTIDVTMAHDLAGIAQGEDAGVMWKIRPIMRWASFLFHHAERFNRQVTFVAAYRLAREAGANHKTAFEQATKATYDGHFDYGAANRPRIMQGNVAKVLLLFKQYGQNMVYTLSRNAYQSIKGTDAEKAEARKALAGLLTSHAMAAGVLGLPMVTTLLAAASMIGGDDDEPWDAKVALQNMLADAFGQKPAEVLAHGLSRLTPWDISGRVGLDRLIFPDVQEGLEGQRLAESAMAAALGPVAGIGVNVLKGAQHMSEGRYAMGLEAMLPSALRGPVKALRYADEGVQDKSGISILDQVSPAAVAGQALGFSPSAARNAQEGKSAILAHDRALNERRQELLTKISRATMAKDEEAKAEAREEIRRFNEKNPGRRINPNHIMASVRGRQKRIDQAQDGVYLPRNRREAMEAGRFAVVD